MFTLNLKEATDEDEQPFAGSRGLVSNYRFLQLNIDLGLATLISSSATKLHRVTVLVENVEDGREYTVEETHNSEAEISQISVQDPLRYL